jgi:hypothetical protein
MERKGVSTYISVLLLIVVVIAGGVLIYGYTMGWFGRLGTEGQMGTLSIDESSGNATYIRAYIRNVGSSSITLDAAYVSGNLVADANVFVEGVALTTPTAITQGSVVFVEIANAGISGTTYEVKLVAVDNTQLVFSVKID